MEDLFLAICFGIVVGYIFKIMFATAQHLNAETKHKVQPKTGKEIEVKECRRLTYEIIDGVQYFYYADNNTFAAQGRTLQDAAKHFTLAQGQDKLGFFKHVDQRGYCFINSQFMEVSNVE